MLRSLQRRGRRLLAASSIACVLSCSAGVLSAHQVPANVSTEVLDQRYRRLRTSYDAELTAARNAVSRVRPDLLQAFDRNATAWSAYIAAECEDMPDKLFKGGSAAPNLALRCKLSLYEAQLGVLQRNYAPLRH